MGLAERRNHQDAEPLANAHYPMAIALLGQRAQTLPIEHPGRYSSPDWVSYASRRKELRVEMRPLSVDWELPRRSLPVDKETVPKTPLPNIKDIGHNLDDPIELTDGEEGNNDDGASITATMDSETGFARPGATEAQAQSALGKDRSTMQHISQGSERHQDQLDSSFLHDRVEDLSKADDLVLHEMLMRAPVDDDNLNGYDEAKTGPASNLQAGMKEENTLKDMYSQKKSPASTGSEISQLMGDLLQEDVAAVVGASQVPYDGPGNEAGRAPRADMAMESDSLTSRDGNGVRCQKQKPQTAMLSSEKHPEGRVPKKARSNEPISQHTNDIVPTARPNIGYTGTMRSPGSTQSSAASPKSRRTKMTTPEREESRRLSALKYRRKKAQERALGQSAVSLGRTGSQGHSSNHSSPGFSSSRDGEREAALNPTRMGFAALSRWSPSPSHCNLILPQPVSKRGHPKSNQKSPKSEGKRDRRQEYQRLNERRRLEKEDKEFQDAIGSATTSFATTAGAVGEFYFESMDPMEVDSEPEEDLSRPATGGKTITKEMIDILQHKPESLTSYVSKGPQQAEDGDGTYYEFLVKRLSWTADNVEEPEDIEPLLCGSGYISVEAANKAAGDEIQLERGDIRVYPLDEFHWKRDRETGMAICDASSERGNVRVFVDRVLRPRDQGIKPSKRALKAARKINPTVYVIIVKNTMVNAADSEALDELFEEQSPERTSVHVEIDVVGVCRTRDLANKMASKYVLNRLKEYQDAGKLEEIKRAEDEAEQRKYLGDLEEEEGFYCIETELPGGSGLLEVWVKAQFLKGPCN